MEKVIGILVGVIVFAAVLLGGLLSKTDPERVILNAVIMGWLGYFAGWLLWGKLGVSIAGYFNRPDVEPKPEAPKSEEKKQ